MAVQEADEDDILNDNIEDEMDKVCLLKTLSNF